MSLYRRQSVWWVRFTTPAGQRVRRSAGTVDKKKAQEFHDRLKAELWKVQTLGERPRRPWEEAVVRWMKEKAHKASIHADKMHFRWLDQHLRGKALSSINRDMIDRLIEARQLVIPSSNRQIGSCHLRTDVSAPRGQIFMFCHQILLDKSWG